MISQLRVPCSDLLWADIENSTNNDRIPHMHPRQTALTKCAAVATLGDTVKGILRCGGFDEVAEAVAAPLTAAAWIGTASGAARVVLGAVGSSDETRSLLLQAGLPETKGRSSASSSSDELSCTSFRLGRI